MKTSRFFQATLALCVVLLSNHSPAAGLPRQSGAAAGARLTVNFDSNWSFLKGDAPGAEQSNFNDTGWRRVDLPNDWSIAGPFAETNLTGGAGGFLPSGVAWYRNSFSLPKEFANRRVFIEFDGVMQNSDVWINGVLLGHRPFGYVGLSYELTGHLTFGGNVLAVRADTSVQPASRFYAGAGIYRHVRLVVTDPVHIEPWGVFVTTPQVSAKQATVHVQTTVTNQSDTEHPIFVRVSLLGPDGKNAGNAGTYSQTLAAGKSAQFDQDIIVKNPQLWNLDSPALYRALVTVEEGINGPVSHTLDKPLDSKATTFGIRDAHFEADTGFWLNGKNFKVKGVCLHADGGAFGMAVPLDIWEQRLAELKKLGVNAIRTAHNPPAPEFLDLCDRMGFLVMDEMFDCWTVGKSGLAGERLADYHLYFNDCSSVDTADTVRRDRNHPSIILYSAGNEIHDTPNAALAIGILQRLVSVFHTNDPSRPVTQALFRPNTSHDYDDGLADLLDVVGQNYRENEILAAHTQKPTRKIIGTENGQTRQSWVALRDNAPYAGQFLWAGIDYLGESRSWPVVGSGSGLLDRTGAPKPMAFERQSWWSDQPMVAIARRASAAPGMSANRQQGVVADWTPENLQPHNENVEVYSNCKEVELFLNGQSLGTKAINADAAPRTWSVPFAPGTLRAVARNDGKVVATDELRTAGSPAKIALSTDAEKLAPGWDNVAIVRVKVVDANGIEIPRADNLISFTISGPGVIAAVDNADNSSHEPFQATERRAFEGKCVAFVKATGSSGRIVLTATTPGLASGSIAINTAKPSP